MTVSATQFPTKWCPFQPPRSKTVGGGTFLVAKSVIFQEWRKTSKYNKMNYVPNINVNNNINCWYVVLILLHWWNNKKKIKNDSAKKIHFRPLSPVKKILNIPRRKKNQNKSYWKFNFSMGTVLVLFSFFWTDNAPCPPPCALQCVKLLISIVEKKNENYVEFYFSMRIVLVIFSFFWMVNDLVCVPPPLCGMSSVFSTPELFTYFRA